MRILFIAVLFLNVVCAAQGVGSYVIHDVRVFDGYAVIEHRDVRISDGKIDAVTESSPALATGERVIDGRGRTLIPGLIDSHVHIPLNARDALRQGLLLGVTTQLDMYSSPEKLKLIRSFEAEDSPELSDVRTAGMGATVPGGHPTQMGGGNHPELPTLTTKEEAQAFVDARIAEGSDYIKLILDDGREFGKHWPTLDDETLRALVKAAHKRGKLVVVHALTEGYAQEAILAGADGLAHMYEGPSLNIDFGALAAHHHVFVIPTLSTIYLDCGKSPGSAILADPHLSMFIRKEWQNSMNVPQDPKTNSVCDSTAEGMRQLIAAHVPILAGTDTPVPGTTYGASLHGELSLLVETGMTPLQALQAATLTAAHTFHLDDRGSIKRGLRADLLLVEGDPTKTIEDTRNIVAVWKRGVMVERTPIQ